MRYLAGALVLVGVAYFLWYLGQLVDRDDEHDGWSR